MREYFKELLSPNQLAWKNKNEEDSMVSNTEGHKLVKELFKKIKQGKKPDGISISPGEDQKREDGRSKNVVQEWEVSGNNFFIKTSL